MKPQLGGWEALQPMLGDEQPDETLTAGDWAMVAFIVAATLGTMGWWLFA